MIKHAILICPTPNCVCWRRAPFVCFQSTQNPRTFFSVTGCYVRLKKLLTGQDSVQQSSGSFKENALNTKCGIHTMLRHTSSLPRLGVLQIACGLSQGILFPGSRSDREVISWCCYATIWPKDLLTHTATTDLVERHKSLSVVGPANTVRQKWQYLRFPIWKPALGNDGPSPIRFQETNTNLEDQMQFG